MPVRSAQMAAPEMTSVLALFRRAANVLARLEDAVVFRGLTASPAPPPRQAQGRVPGSPADLGDPRRTTANNPQQSWGFEGEPPEAVIKDSGTRDGTL
jgi:hypothetical protein